MYHEPLPVISDFGISKKVSTNYSKTSASGISTQWAAPEQLHQHRFGRSSDIFSLGLIFCFMFFKALDIDRIEQHLRSHHALGYTPGSMTQRHLNNVIKRVYGKIWTIFDRSAKKMLEAMLKVDVGNRSKIGEVQHDIESIMRNTDENFQSHCRWNSDAHYPSSGEENIEDTDINDDFWLSSVIHSSDSSEDDEDDRSEGENEDTDNEGSEEDTDDEDIDDEDTDDEDAYDKGADGESADDEDAEDESAECR